MTQMSQIARNSINLTEELIFHHEGHEDHEEKKGKRHKAIKAKSEKKFPSH